MAAWLQQSLHSATANCEFAYIKRLCYVECGIHVGIAICVKHLDNKIQETTSDILEDEEGCRYSSKH